MSINSKVGATFGPRHDMRMRFGYFRNEIVKCKRKIDLWVKCGDSDILGSCDIGLAHQNGSTEYSMRVVAVILRLVCHDGW